MLSSAEFGRLIEGFKRLDGGYEHRVYYVRRSGRVFKATKDGRFGYPWYLRDYLQNLVWCNEVFGDDVVLEGVTQSSEGTVVVISQPFVRGRKPTEEEIAEWFHQQGCTRLAPLLWAFPDGMVVGDAHPGNLILMEDGSMVPIDLRVEKPGAGMRPAQDPTIGPP